MSLIERKAAYLENSKPTLVDRFGVWLSARRIRGLVPDFRGKRVADIGCGFNATFARTVIDEAASVVLVDVNIAPDLEAHSKVSAIKGALPASLSSIKTNSQDVIMCVSVLEHLDEPAVALAEFHRILAPGGVCLLNVPSWRGKRYLEFSAFVLHMSPADEMNDHKMYYDVKDLWPLLVKAGFRPQDVRVASHKFGLNTYAICKKEG